MSLFGTFGYKEQGLFDEYKKLHPNVTVNYTSTEQESQYYPALLQKLNTPKGTVDIAGIEVGRVADVTQNRASKFVDLKTLGADPSLWYDWKSKAITTKDGAFLGLGTDVGPLAYCYRSDLFKAAGLDSDPAKLKTMWSSWDAFVDFGKQYTAKTHKAFLDSSGGLFQAVLGASEKQYYDENGTPIYDSNPAVKEAWDVAAKAATAGITFKQPQFSDEWNKGFASGGFAGVNCPSWMIGYIKGQAGNGGSGKWNVVEPPGAGNWGGSYLAIPKNSQHQAEAYQLAAWLTAKEQEVKLFVKAGSFPSVKAAADDPAVKGAKDPYFSNAPIGQIFGDVASQLPVATLGPKDGDIKTAFTNGLVTIETQGKTSDEAWAESLKNIKNIVGG